jgi:hypothetical protein
MKALTSLQSKNIMLKQDYKIMHLSYLQKMASGQSCAKWLHSTLSEYYEDAKKQAYEE